MFNLISKFVPGPYQLFAKIGVVVLAGLLAWYAWAQFTGHYIDIGRAQLQPKLDQAIAENKRVIGITYKWRDAYALLGNKTAECNASVAALANKSAQAKIASARALKSAEAKATLKQRAVDAAYARQISEAGKGCSDAVRDARRDLDSFLQ